MYMANYKVWHHHHLYSLKCFLFPHNLPQKQCFFESCNLLLTVIFALTSSTGHTGLGGDRHQGLSDGLLPALSHLHADSWGCQSGAVVVTAVVLPYIVHHGGCDDLKAVWVAALGQITVVSGLFHLEDFGQRDFLWEGWGTEITTNIKNKWNTNIIFWLS